MGTRTITIIVDDCDDDLLMSMNDHLRVGEGKRGVRLHQAVMERKLGEPVPDKMLIDHENGNPFDNRRSNLRLATHRQNAANSKRKVGVSGYRGVSWSKGIWIARIGGLSKSGQHYDILGRSHNPAVCARMYDRAAIDRYGEFAVLNFPRSDYES